MKCQEKLKVQRNMNREIDFGREKFPDRSAEGRGRNFSQRNNKK